MKKSFPLILIFFLLFASSAYNQTASEYLELGLKKSSLKDYKGAIMDYTKAITLDPKSAKIYYNRGNAKSKLQDYIGAIVDLSKAIEINPEYEAAYNNRGHVKSKINEYEDAIVDYNKAIAIDPNDELAYYNRGLSKFSLKNYYGGIADCDKSIEINPKIAEVYYSRGVAKSTLKEYQAAIVDYTKAIEIDPMYAAAYLNRGAVKAYLVDYKGTIMDCTNAINIDPKLAMAYMNRGLAKINLGQKESGCQDLKKATDLGYSEAKEAIKQYCTNVSEEYIRSFKLGKKTTDVPELKAKDFLQKFPLAKEIRTYTSGKDTLDIPIKEVTNFLKEVPDAKPLHNYREKLPTWDETTEIPVEPKLPEFTDFVPPEVLAENKAKTQTGKVDISSLHFQIDKIKVGDTFIDLPIPSGFVKIDSSLREVFTASRKLCPPDQTVVAYYIGEKDYARYLVGQYNLFEDYIAVTVLNNIKYRKVNNKDYRKIISEFKKMQINEFKQSLDKGAHDASDQLSKLNEDFNINFSNVQPFGLCYESKNSISLGVLTKYNVNVRNESSSINTAAVIATITKINNKPIYLYLGKSLKEADEIESLKNSNSTWIAEIDKKQGPGSFWSDIDFQDYKEALLAILTLSFLWGIYIATKKIYRKMKTKNVPEVPENTEPDDKNDYVDFDELLIDEKITAQPVHIESEKIQVNVVQTLKPEATNDKNIVGPGINAENQTLINKKSKYRIILVTAISISLILPAIISIIKENKIIGSAYLGSSSAEYIGLAIGQAIWPFGTALLISLIAMIFRKKFPHELFYTLLIIFMSIIVLAEINSAFDFRHSNSLEKNDKQSYFLYEPEKSSYSVLFHSKPKIFATSTPFGSKSLNGETAEIDTPGIFERVEFYELDNKILDKVNKDFMNNLFNTYCQFNGFSYPEMKYLENNIEKFGELRAFKATTDQNGNNVKITLMAKVFIKGNTFFATYVASKSTDFPTREIERFWSSIK